jgi:hypothetical protein
MQVPIRGTIWPWASRARLGHRAYCRLRRRAGTAHGGRISRSGLRVRGGVGEELDIRRPTANLVPMINGRIARSPAVRLAFR